MCVNVFKSATTYWGSFLSGDARWSRTSPLSLQKKQQTLAFYLQHSPLHMTSGRLLCFRNGTGLPSVQALQTCQEDQIYRGGRDLPEDRTQTQFNLKSDGWWFVLWVEMRPFTFSPSVPKGPRSPTSPGWPSGPCEVSNKHHKQVITQHTIWVHQ